MGQAKTKLHYLYDSNIRSVEAKMCVFWPNSISRSD